MQAETMSLPAKTAVPKQAEQRRPSSQLASPEQRGRSEGKSQSGRYQAELKHTNKVAQRKNTIKGLSLDAVPGPTGGQHMGEGPR